MRFWDLLHLRIFCLAALVVMARSNAPDHCPGKVNFRQCFVACEKGNGKGYTIYNKKDGTPCKTVFLKDGTCRRGRCFTGTDDPVKIYRDFVVSKSRRLSVLQ